MSDTEFTWIPFFEELAERLLDYRHRQAELIAVLKRANQLLTEDYDIGGSGSTIKTSRTRKFRWSKSIRFQRRSTLSYTFSLPPLG